MFEAYLSIHILTMIASVFIIIKIAFSKPSKTQSSCLTFACSIYMFAIAYYIELTTPQVEVIRAVIKIEYFSVCSFMLSLLWFISEFCKIKTPRWLYIVQGFIGSITVFVIFTMDFHDLYCKNITVEDNGFFLQCVVEPGWYYYVHIIDYTLVMLYAIVACTVQVHKSKGVDKKRVGHVLVGLYFAALIVTLKALGLTGGCDIISIGMFGTMVCFFAAFLRYGYFNSIQAAAENIVNFGKEGLVVTSTDYEILFKNETCKKILPEIISAKTISEVATLKEAFSVGNGEITISNAIYEVRVERIEEYGNLQGYLLWLIDMTEHYSYVRQLKEMTEYAEASNKSKSIFLTSMSHEIRTPMNAILGMNEMILRENSDRQITEYANSINDAGKSLLSIINDILDISKIESGKLEINPAPYELSSVLNDVVNMTLGKAKGKGLDYHVEVAADVPYMLVGDEARIRQIMVNIANNAVKYTHTGSISIKIRCEWQDESHIRLIIAVADTGIGIRREDLSRLYKSFQRLDQPLNRNIEGTGLGLVITKQLIDKMGGSISVESEYGNGSVFTVTLPQPVENKSPIGNFEEIRLSAKQKQHNYTESFIAPDVRILVVDDNEMNLMVVLSLIKQTQIKTDTALSGRQCIDMVEKNAYDIIFLDQMMPEMDGIHTLAELRRRNLAVGVPVIALTANAILGAREMFIKNGFTDYISKPISYDKFEKMIVSHLPPEAVTIIEKSEKDFSLIPEIDGVDVNGALKFFSDNTEEYIKILRIYVRISSESINALEEFLKTEDMANYSIRVHSLKSTSSNIGANETAEIARLHEIKSNENDIEFIGEDFERLRASVLKTVGSINSYLSTIKPKKAESIPGGAISEPLFKMLLIQAREKLEELDPTEDGKNILCELAKCAFPHERLEQLRSAASYAEDFEFEKSIELVDLMLQ